MNDEQENNIPIKSNFEERLNYFKLHPERLKHYINVMKARYKLLKDTKNDKKRKKPSL